MSQRDGGPAFPRLEQLVGADFADGAFDRYDVVASEGISAREYFAGHALTALGPLNHHGDPEEAQHAAEAAYRYADAMLAAGERAPEADPDLLEALERIAEDAPETEPEYDDWGGDTERAENYGSALEHWRLAEIAREAIAKARGKS